MFFTFKFKISVRLLEKSFISILLNIILFFSHSLLFSNTKNDVLDKDKRVDLSTIQNTTEITIEQIASKDSVTIFDVIKYTVRIKQETKLSLNKVIVKAKIPENTEYILNSIFINKRNYTDSLDEDEVYYDIINNEIIYNLNVLESNKEIFLSFQIRVINCMPQGISSCSSISYLDFNQQRNIKGSNELITFYKDIGEVEISNKEGCGFVELDTKLIGNLFKYQWYKDGRIIKNAKEFKYQAEESGLYTVKITSNKFCTFSLQFNVKINPISIINFDGTEKGGCEFVELDSKVDPHDHIIKWYKNGNLIKNASGQKYTAIENGIYSLKVISKDNCISSKDVKVNINPLPKVNFGSSELISYEFVELDSKYDDSLFKIQWYKDGKLLKGEKSRKYLVKENGLYSVMIISPKGCSYISEIRVVIPLYSK